MLLARMLDDKFASLYRGGKIQGGVFLGRGQEALSVAAGLSLRPGDFFAPLIRDAAGRLAFGETILEAVRTYLGSPLGPMMARDGNVHRGNPRKGIFPMVSHLGATISVVNGVLLASRFKGVTGRVGLASIGEGATSTGSFHEVLGYSAEALKALSAAMQDAASRSHTLVGIEDMLIGILSPPGAEIVELFRGKNISPEELLSEVRKQI